MLYRPGGYIVPHVDTKRTAANLATLTVQLPSHFMGGNVVLRSDGRDKVFDNGADAGSNCFTSFYTVCFPDVEQEMRPIVEGYRLTLVYNLSWIGKGVASTPNVRMYAERMSHVAAAFQSHVDNSPSGDWHLASMLENEYTSAQLSSYGTEALKEVDRCNVFALREAAERLGIGELDFVLCRLSQAVTDWKDDMVSCGLPKVVTLINKEKAYWDTGAPFRRGMGLPNWDFVSFTPESRKDQPMRKLETFYKTMVVVTWANSHDIEAMFRGDVEVDWILRF